MHCSYIENKTSDRQEKTNLSFSSNFPDAEEVNNRQKHQLSSYNPCLQLLIIKKMQCTTNGYCDKYIYIQVHIFTLMEIGLLCFLLSSLAIRYPFEICFISLSI